MLEGTPIGETPAVETPPEPSPAPRRKHIECECCGCKLTQDGEIIKMGDQAKTWRDTDTSRDRTIDGLKADIARLTRELADANAKRAGWR